MTAKIVAHTTSGSLEICPRLFLLNQRAPGNRGTDVSMQYQADNGEVGRLWIEKKAYRLTCSPG